MGLLTDLATNELYRVTCDHCGQQGWNDEQWVTRHSRANAKYSGIFHRDCAWAVTTIEENENKEFYDKKRGGK